MNKIILFITLFSVFNLTSQNLKGVDTIVLNYHEFKTIDELTDKIERDFNSDKEKARAAYTWIANNIRYDNLYLYTPKNYIYTSQKDYEEQKNKRIDKLATTTFNTKKGICFGYASLFNKICNNLNVKSEIVIGFAKSKVTATNRQPTLVSNHAWNKIIINDKSHLIDTTWSITIIPNKKGYIKDINYDYFFTNPYLFVLDHYPENFEDSLINGNISEFSFINHPKIHLKGYKGIRLIRPIKSRINRSKKTNTNFTFQILRPVKTVSFYLGNQFHKNIPFSLNNNILTFGLDLENIHENNLTLYINNKAICSYWLE